MSLLSDWREFVFAHAEWLLIVSACGLLIGVIATPFLVTWIPPEYFSHNRRHVIDRGNPIIGWIFLALKNVVGAVFFVAGILMLFLPGQGLLTVLLGLMIMNYPGKYALERWLVTRPKVLPALNWLRGKRNHPPLESPR